MKLVIIEDESIAIRKLKKLIHEINPEIEVVGTLESVFDAKKWFQANSLSQLDLLLCDIQLSDGLSFEIFETIEVNIPIIFTTAYDEYALKAFKVNGVDYLLKPIQKEELKQAFDRFEYTKKRYSQNQLADIQHLINQFQNPSVNLPSFICYQKDKLTPLAGENIAYFYIQNLVVYAVVDKAEFVLEESMDEIEKRLPPKLFFRANRQFIIQKKYILNAEIYFNNRLLVHLTVKTKSDIIISREKSTLFKNWLMGF